MTVRASTRLTGDDRRIRVVRGFVHAPAGTMLAALLLAAAGARAAAQLPEAPEPTLRSPGVVCPAVAEFEYDVSSVAGANRVLWQLRRGTANQGFAAATEVDEGVAQGASGVVVKDLRDFGRVLDGTRYFFRVRARQGATNLTDFSPPVRFDMDVSADDALSAITGPTPATLRFDWSLSGALARCADRVVVRIEKADGPGSSEFVGTGASGSRIQDLGASGPGDYEVRLQARHGGDAAQDDIGRQSAPVRVTVAAPTVAIEFFRLQNGAANVNVTVPVTLDAVIVGATPSEYKAAPCGLGFTSASFQPWPGSPPPVLPGFTTAGERTVCFQVRNQSSTSAVASDAIQVVAQRTVDELRRFDPGAVTSITGPADLGPGPADLAPAPVISSFQIRGGDPFVTVGQIFDLTVTVSGSPTEVRAISSASSACESALASRPWQAFSASTPLTMVANAAGPLHACVQFKRGAQTSSVATDQIEVVRSSWTSVIIGEGGYAIGSLDCGQQFAVGVVVRAGWWIDALALRCAGLTATGSHQSYSTTRFLGGGGGEPAEVICLNGTVLYGFVTSYGDYVNRINLYCIDWTADRGSVAPFARRDVVGGSFSGDREATAFCPGPLAVSSMEVFGGSYVEGFRFTCKTPERM